MIELIARKIVIFWYKRSILTRDISAALITTFISYYILTIMIFFHSGGGGVLESQTLINEFFKIGFFFLSGVLFFAWRRYKDQIYGTGYIETRAKQYSKDMDELQKVLKMRDKKLAESESKFRAIISNASDGIIVIDEKGNMTLINPAACEIFGYDSYQELLGKSVTVLMPDEMKDKHADYVYNFFNSPQHRGLIGKTVLVQGQTKQKHIVELEISLSAGGPDSGVIGGTGGDSYVLAIIRKHSDRPMIIHNGEHKQEE